MSHLVHCEDVTVGTRLRYVGREFIPVKLKLQENADGWPGWVATAADGRTMFLHYGWDVWAMEETE